MSEREPLRVPVDVLEGLEAVRRHLGHNVLDVATIRYFANERGTTHPRHLDTQIPGGIRPWSTRRLPSRALGIQRP